MMVDVVLPGDVRIPGDECQIEEKDEGNRLVVHVPMRVFCEAMADVWATMCAALDEHEKS